MINRYNGKECEIVEHLPPPKDRPSCAWERVVVEYKDGTREETVKEFLE